jgi:hypothetical protein
MKKDRREQSELFLQDEESVMNENYAWYWSNLILCSFRENKSYGVKTITLILCLHVAVHHVPNSYSIPRWRRWRTAGRPEAEEAANRPIGDWDLGWPKAESEMELLYSQAEMEL